MTLTTLKRLGNPTTFCMGAPQPESRTRMYKDVMWGVPMYWLLVYTFLNTVIARIDFSILNRDYATYFGIGVMYGLYIAVSLVLLIYICLEDVGRSPSQPGLQQEKERLRLLIYFTVVPLTGVVLTCLYTNYLYMVPIAGWAVFGVTSIYWISTL